MTPPYSEATVELVARAIFRHRYNANDSQMERIWGKDPATRASACGSANAALDALAAAGRLLPEGAETRTEWAVWWLGPSGGIRLSQEHLTSRTEAEQMAPDRIGKYGIVRWELRYRELHDFADGSCLSGPWSAVPPESEES